MFGVFKRLSVLIILFAFLLSVAGINIIKHTCNMCQTTTYYLFADTHKCEKTNKTIAEEPSSCCSKKHEADKQCAAEKSKSSQETGCCQSKKIYVKVTDNFVNSSYNSIVKTSINYLQFPLLLTVFINKYSAEDSDIQTYHPPPLLLFGKQIIILFHQLIFYAHS